MFPICTLATESVTETKCATQIFANALINTADTVKESDYEDIIQQWVVTTFAAPDVLTAVLECPEITAIDETETIKFTPIIYKFPTGREIIINYETQPLVLKQRIQAKQKRALPTSDANPRVGAGTAGCHAEDVTKTVQNQAAQADRDAFVIFFHREYLLSETYGFDCITGLNRAQGYSADFADFSGGTFQRKENAL